MYFFIQKKCKSKESWCSYAIKLKEAAEKLAKDQAMSGVPMHGFENTSRGYVSSSVLLPQLREFNAAAQSIGMVEYLI